MDVAIKNNYRKMFAEGVIIPILEYNLNEIDLITWAKSTFGIMELQNLHQLPDPIVFASYVDRLYYRVNQLKQNVEEIRQACTTIKEEILVPLFGEIQKFQFPPSIRCHLSGARTASAFHKDGDPKYGVTPGTLNLWIPLTRVSGNNSIYTETTCDAGNYKAITLNPGEMLVFDAFNLKHGSYQNDTTVSRVSIDIRFVPKDTTIARELGLYAK